jgi:hypothetical protein
MPEFSVAGHKDLPGKEGYCYSDNYGPAEKGKRSRRS